MPTDPTAAGCTDPCIACMTDESHDPAPPPTPNPAAPADQPSIRDTIGPADGQQKMRLLARLHANTSPVPAPADRASVLREAAGQYERLLADLGADTAQDPRYWTGVHHVITGLRHMADEAQQAEQEPTPLRWSLNDVMWGDDDTTTVMLSGPAGEPYWLELDPERATRAAAFLDSLTARERALFHDAAVMGYIQGLMRDRSEGELKDSQTMALVVDACFAFPHLYPAVNADIEEQRQTIEYFVQCQQPDDSWEQCTSTFTEPRRVVQQLAAQRQARPQFEYRIARRTTTALIEIALDPES